MHNELAGKIFAREATGLIREISPFAALVTTIVLTNYRLGMATFETYTPYLYPGGESCSGGCLRNSICTIKCISIYYYVQCIS